MVIPANAPNFFLLGGAKCGSTTFYHALRQHPDIYLIPDKEAHFFNADAYFRKGLETYLGNHFAGAEAFPIRGEATPQYLDSAGKVAPRMRAMLGDDLRFISVLRNPAQRAWSHYLHQLSIGGEHLSFQEALEAEEIREAEGRNWVTYFKDGMYACHLEEWFRHYPRHNFQIFLLEDLQRDLGGVARESCRFLGVDEGVTLDTHARHNPVATVKHAWLGGVLNRPNSVTNVLKEFVPYGIRRRVRARINTWNRRSLSERPKLDPNVERGLRERYKGYTERLESLIDRDLSDWK